MCASKARAAYRSLNGLVCVYKAPGVSTKYIKESLCTKLSNGLNELDDIKPRNYLEVYKNSETEITVNIRPSYGDNVLAIGPRFEPHDFTLTTTPMDKIASGVCAPLNIIQVSGKLGEATRYLYRDGKVVAKAFCKNVKRTTFESVIASYQAAHQRKIHSSLGVDMQTQEAYELLAQGPVKPLSKDVPAIYSIKCIDFKLPHFCLELICINASPNYLLQLIHDLGLQLRTFAHTTCLRYVRYGPFAIRDALIEKQWKIPEIIDNMKHCKDTIENVNSNDVSEEKNYQGNAV